MSRKYYRSANRRAFYESQMLEQEGRCGICKRRDRLVIDHSHETGLMRGLLCRRHSTGLRLFFDDPELLRAAAGYLEQHKPEPLIAPVEVLTAQLLSDNSFPSDRARARVLAEKVGLLISTAQTRIHRARKKLAK